MVKTTQGEAQQASPPYIEGWFVPASGGRTCAVFPSQ
jgi:hypothetical protein